MQVQQIHIGGYEVHFPSFEDPQADRRSQMQFFYFLL